MAYSESERHAIELTGHEYHEKGCVVRHPGNPPAKSSCDYRWNGYQISSKARKRYYNKEPEFDTSAAYQLIKSRLAGKRLKKYAGRMFGKYHGRYKKDFEENPKVWFIGESHPPEIAQNFVPRSGGGPGWNTPYLHNWHHIVPNGAIREYIGGGPHGDKPLHLLMLSGYNINEKANVVLLPKETLVGHALGLPTHCPYGQRSHPNYSKKTKTELVKVRNRLDKLIDTEVCQDEEKDIQSQLKDPRQQVRKLAGALFNMTVRVMPGGTSIDDF